MESTLYLSGVPKLSSIIEQTFFLPVLLSLLASPACVTPPQQRTNKKKRLWARITTIKTMFLFDKRHLNVRVCVEKTAIIFSHVLGSDDVQKRK